MPPPCPLRHPPLIGPGLGCVLTACILALGRLPAQEWEGPFAIIPVSAPQLVLEAVGAGTAEGTPVSLGHPGAEASKVWIISPKGDGLYAIRPSHAPSLTLAVGGGRSDNGAAIVLEKEGGKPWQAWTIRTHDDGSASLSPQHAPGKALDDFGGGATAGARQDLWDYRAGDGHLRWVLRPLAGARLPAAAPTAPDAPRGVVKPFTFAGSALFPGTQRNGMVFIPGQYDGSRPACVYVRQDGYHAKEKEMLEALIAAKDMPVTIGVFVSPGILPAPMEHTLGRRNRCFEYDGVGDGYVRFLAEELLPYVARTFDLKLTASGNDRCIAGGSSGGIAAFTAAWERPDLFSRVYANSGSFVAFRGGHEFPTLIRKQEARPVRAFLTTGTRDMENCAGNWYLLDQEMDKALTFSGYDHVFRPLDGPHVAGWNECFPDAMRFIWKGWPEPVAAGPSAPRVRDVITPEATWELLGEGYRGACSPAGNSAGEVFVIDTAANAILRIGLDRRVAVFAADAAQANGLAIGPKDELYTVSRTSGNLLRYDRSGHSEVLAAGLRGNHVLARPDGALYVTAGDGQGGGGASVWLVREGRATQVDTGLKSATGLAYRPDQWLLTVADGGSKWVYSYQIRADGSLGDKERYFWLHLADGDDDTGAESVCYAKEGQMLVATRLGVQVCADDGPTQAILPLPDRSRVVGVCLGGADGATLYALGGGRIWTRAVKLHGIGAFSPWSAVRGSPL